MARSQKTGTTLKVANYVANSNYIQLPKEVIAKAKDNLLDTLGAMIMGSQLDVGKVIVQFATQQASKGESTVIGAEFKNSPIMASMVNAVLGHADEVDSTYELAPVHAGCVIIPSALAIGEQEKADGKALINAIVTGYEISCRMGRAMDERVLRKHNHSSLGIATCFGAAATACCLLQLTEKQVCSALGLVGQQAAGTYSWLQEPRHMAKAFETGIAARNGVTAALLAKSGFDGPPAIFEGTKNIFDAFSKKNNFKELVQYLGNEYEIMKTVMKKYSAGGPLQNPLEGLFQIMQTRKLKATDISEIKVIIPKYSQWLVHKRSIKDINLELIIAAAAFYGRMGWEEAHSESKLNHPEVKKLQNKVKLIGDATLDKTYTAKWSAKVEIMTVGGRQYKIHMDNMAGSPQNPLTRKQIEDKFVGLTEKIINPRKTKRIIDLVSRLEELNDINKLTQLLMCS